MSERKISIIGGYAYSSVGGIQAVNRFIVAELKQAGALRRAFFLWDDIESAGPAARAAHAAGDVRFFAQNRVRFIGSLIKQMVRYPDDLWLCTHINYAMLGLFVGCFRKRQLALFLYAAELDEDFTVFKLFALRRFTNIFAISDYTKKKAVRLGVQPCRVQVMHIGVEYPDWDCRPSASPQKQQRILFVGRMDERYKGQHELLDAVQLLYHRFPLLHVVFVGGGKTIDTWRQDAHDRGLDNKIEFTGRVSDERLKDEYRRATVFVMVSENEGFGLVYAEAMSFGVPCIAGDRDAASEVIEHGISGMCLPASNSTALADAISQLLRDPALRQRMSLASKRRFAANFTTTGYSERLLATIEAWRALSR
jgi:phosphatidylinositol alpha-1,6-mannosyltransferase